MDPPEKTFLLIKPDGVLRGQVGEVVSRIEAKGLKVVALKLVKVNRELAEEHYAEHEGKPYYDLLVQYVSSAPSVVMIVEGRKAIEVVRRLVGATDPSEAEPGTMRGDLAIERRTVIFNLVHASDSKEAAEREIGLYFDETEIIEYQLPSESIYRL